MTANPVGIIGTLVAASFMLLLFSNKAYAAPIFYPVNGHYYEAVLGAYTWTDASTNAQNSAYLGVNGYLATLTSAEENDWVWNNVLSGPHPHYRYYWLGGYQSPTDQGPANGWQWVTGEPWAWTNWNTAEPNDYLGHAEDYLQFQEDAKWNDTTVNNMLYNNGYIIEYAVPEPASISLAGLGLFGLAVFKRKRKK